MKKLLVAFVLVCFLISLTFAQKDLKPWKDWSDKDVKKVLDSSGWGQLQTDTDTSQIQHGQSSGNGAGGPGGVSSESGLEGAASVNYHMRLFTAKPIRAAFIRQLELKNKIQANDSMKAFVDQNIDQWIIVTVAIDTGADARSIGPSMAAFANATIGSLKNNTYLERKDGKRVFLEKYDAPSNDGFGGKFFFKREFEGKPFLSADMGGTLHFYAEVPSNTHRDPNSSNPNAYVTRIKLETRFKLSDMMYDGKLEY